MLVTKRTWLYSLVARPKPSPARRRLRLEALEVRLASEAYHVTSLLDDGSAGTLRRAINQANTTPGTTLATTDKQNRLVKLWDVSFLRAPKSPGKNN